MQPFVDACLAAPIGAALVARLEAHQRPDHEWMIDDPSADASHVELAASHVSKISFGQLCEEAIRASGDVGPWTSSADEHACLTQHGA